MRDIVRIVGFFRDAGRALRMPRATVNLMLSAASDNDLFYARITREFYESARRRHPKLPLIGALEYGVALCALPPAFDGYFMAIEGSARRNWRKARRGGYVFRRIEYNEHLAEIGAIWRSADVRQGRMPDELLSGAVKPCANPPSRTNLHDYVYYGVLSAGGLSGGAGLPCRAAACGAPVRPSTGEGPTCLAAYAGCLVAGELCMIEQLMGHAEHQSDGIVPFLVVEMAREIKQNHPAVRWFGYGTYFGAGLTMRRFKRKLGFAPHRVSWTLG